MVTNISQEQFRDDNADIMRRVEQGEAFVVTRDGTTVADVVPHRTAAAQPFLPVTDVAIGLKDTGDWGVDAFRHERRLLDAVLDDADRDHVDSAPD